MQDLGLFINKDNTCTITPIKETSDDTIEYEDGTYTKNHEACLLNKKGKSFRVWSVGNPMPLKLTYKKADWLDTKTLLPVINNEQLKRAVKVTDPGKELLHLYGAICGILSFLGMVIVGLKVYGVIK